MFRDDTKQLVDSIDNQLICVTDKLVDHKDKPEMIVTSSTQIEKWKGFTQQLSSRAALINFAKTTGK